MTKFSVTKDGENLSKDLYTWDKKTKTFSSNVDGLVLDFTDVNGVTFNTGSFCTFITNSYCTFITSSSCTFITGSFCTFITSFNCTFKTSSYCVFKTGPDCTFNTGFDCIFKTGSDCTFKTGENCFVTRFDVKGVTEIPEIPVNKTIKFNEYGITGYTIIEEKKEISSCDGKIVEIDGKKYKLIEQ
jgi:hypothetical protein